MSHQPKRQRSSHPNNQNRNDDAIAGPSNMEISPNIFKLNIDCFDELFEYLSLKDLHSFGQTCKLMNRVAGEYFKQNYSSAPKYCNKDGIYMIYSNKDGVVSEVTQVPEFNQFTKCIIFKFHEYFGQLMEDFFTHSVEASRASNEALHYAESHISEFKSVDHITLKRFGKINQQTIKFIEHFLPQLESVKINTSKITCNLYEAMLKNCHNLKKIYVQKSSMIDNSWISQEYPKLEHFELLDDNQHQYNELGEFFERNPNLQTFSINFRILWKSREIFLNSKIKLNILVLKIVGGDTYSGGHLNQFEDLLNQLYEQGFYKELHFYNNDKDNAYAYSDSLTSFKELKLLCIETFDQRFNLPQLINLTELSFEYLRE
ncbi:uncharacterized protein LOC116349274 [Contarinia nasturtii]|uniref:uncharacterized protein LOC116349274 n=1 Tax=Contarinia nasturtii TaxID=265458 RepID=UPI0012D408A6|nr:uncharacterized protein LOC116349274 [Contarinia nasturtii]